jgi:nitrate reductase NapE component
MADKPAEKKAAPAGGGGDSMEAKAFVFFAIFILLFVVITALMGAFGFDVSAIFNAHAIKEWVIEFLAKTFTTITFISVFFTLLFAVLISYVTMRKNQVMEMWEASQKPGSSSPAGDTSRDFPTSTTQPLPHVLPGADIPVGVHGPQPEAANSRWLDVEQKINSGNPGDWRLAILEADIILDDMLREMGLPGDNLGERLKAADPSFFNTLQDAWSAHKIRNIIAHEGASYNLSYNEARRAIDLFEKVFREFYYI